MNTLPRRQILAALLAGGFALAVSPVSSATIHTRSSGLLTGSLDIATADGSALPLYFARPGTARGTLPVVIVIQEIFGVHAYIQDVCRRLAHAGYLAIAPELFVRQGDPRGIADIPELIRQIVSKVPDAQVMADIDAVIAWAGMHDGDPQRIAITGFCWGGRISWLYAAHNPAIRAAVAWYGRLGGDSTALTPAHPLDVASSLTVPVLGLYAEQDKGISVESVEKMRVALGPESSSRIQLFPAAEHGFHADYRPSYNAAAAAEGWQLMLDWFASHGVKARTKP